MFKKIFNIYILYNVYLNKTMSSKIWEIDGQNGWKFNKQKSKQQQKKMVLMFL